MKELIKKMLKEDGKLSLLLLEARELIGKSSDKDLLNYIDNEINGSFTETNLPDYRKIKGEIRGTIQTPYGGIQNNIPIGLSEVSKQTGIDFTMTFIFDGVGFIEENLTNLSSSYVHRPVNDKLVEILDELVQYNNPGVKLIDAANHFGKAGLSHILVKVRENVIQGLQKIIDTPVEDSRIIDEGNGRKSNERIDVFVTYAWEDEEHNDKIISFVDFLRRKGFNASMDRMKAQEESATNFNKMMISEIQNSHKVIVVLSPKYKEKADEFQGGVGMEYSIILEELKSNPMKFIFVHLGNQKLLTITPTGFGGREVVDLKRDQDEADFNGLFGKLQSKNIINFSNVEQSLPEIKEKVIKAFKL